MPRARAGFTLIELLITMVVIAVLVAIALPNFWLVKDRGFVASMKRDLRTLAVQQEIYYTVYNNYTSTLSTLPEFFLSPSVSITVSYAQPDGWAATADHSAFPGHQCSLFIGDAPVTAPATTAGVMDCN